MQRPSFYNAAAWVSNRQDSSTAKPCDLAEIESALDAMHSFIGHCSATLMLPGLFPGTALDLLFVPALVEGVERALRPDSALPDNAQVSVGALTAIGQALLLEMANTGTDLIRYEMDGGAQILVFPPSQMDVALQAASVTLLGTALA